MKISWFVLFLRRPKIILQVRPTFFWATQKKKPISPWNKLVKSFKKNIYRHPTKKKLYNTGAAIYRYTATLGKCLKIILSLWHHSLSGETSLFLAILLSPLAGQFTIYNRETGIRLSRVFTWRESRWYVFKLELKTVLSFHLFTRSPIPTRRYRWVK